MLYRQQNKCGFSLTTKLDITVLRTALAETGYKFYPLMIYLISRAVNQFPEFRMALKDNELIYWDQSDPVFTMAKFQQEGDRVLLPVSVQIHHAVCDGFHAARFINTLQLMCDNILK